MKKLKIQNKAIASVFSLALATMFSLGLTSCSEEDNAVSLWNASSYNSNGTPVIETVAPNENALAGISTVVITGQNFSSIPSENVVFFNSSMATVTSATANRLEVICPNNVGDSVSCSENLRIAVNKSQLFSNSFPVKVRSAVVMISNLSNQVWVEKTSTVDKNGDLFFAIEKSNTIKKADHVTGTVTEYLPTNDVTSWTGLKFGPGQSLYAVRNNPGIYRLAEGQKPGVPVIQSTKTVKIGNIFDFDFDSKGNIWCGGSASTNNKGADKKPKVYKISNPSTSTYSITAYDFANDVIAVRVFGNYVYFANKSSVYRCQLDASDNLGAAELFYDYQGNGGIGDIVSIAFNEDGEMYAGICYQDNSKLLQVQPVVIVSADGKSAQPLYKDIIFSNPNQASFLNQLNYLCWGGGEPGFYISQGYYNYEANKDKKPKAGLVYVYIGKKGAPLYGNTL
jgi:hypothetical protein